MMDFMASSMLWNQIYWTWGTALAFVYEHRLSTDLDFFSAQLLHEDDILLWIQECKNYFTPKEFEYSVVRNRRLFLIDWLKLEITFFPFEWLFWRKHRKDTMLSIDSPKDIGANKIHALMSRHDMKDVIDLMYICDREHIWREELHEASEQKFGVQIEPQILIARVNYIWQQYWLTIKPFLIDTIDIDRAKLFVENLV